MTYTKDNLRQIFQQPFKFNEWQQMLHHYFLATELRAEPERIDGTTDDEQGYYLGTIDTTDSYRIGLFYYQIQHGNVARKRVGLRNLVKSFVNPNWGEFDAALVVFDSGKLWRLSFVSDIKGESTAPKRYTYVFGEDDSFYNTPVGRFDALQRKGISFENIKEAFSVEALSKEFFDEYREHYADIVEYITGKRYVKEKGKWVEKTIHEPCHEIFDQFSAVYKDPEKTVRDYIKKLMGRLVFLQFLQKKEWMGVPANRQNWTGGDTRFLQNKFNEFADKDNFIDGFLEPLFNDLNTNRQDKGDLASPEVGKGIKIPFLNGGLFQLDEEDCSSVRLPQHLLGDVLDFFERYNFTIDENDPNDAQVGVDPEMLGRVFENLLEDNKDKGAFYTPKEIVQYMCQESLIAYLQTGIDDDADKESIRQFVLTHEAERLGSISEDISIKLLNVKICDPAIGSGAFPMGLLRQLYLCQCAIHPELVEKNAADIKRHIIQNNIYGVDIEKGAVDIARLRFWLSLIVDEETPRFLPNLDFKIMQGNSLLEQYKGVDLSKMTELSSEQGEGAQLTWFDSMLDVLRLDLRQKLDDYYNCSDHNRKEQLKQEIIYNVKQQLREQSINVDFGELDLSANDQFTLWHTWFYDAFSQGGFNIVIGNPPYNELRDIDEQSQDSLKKTPYYKYAKGGRLNLFQFFYPLAINIANEDGIVSLITQNSILAENSTLGNRKLFMERTDIVSVDSFPERDNKKTRVFESVKMSVCICTLKKKLSPSKDARIPITVWHSKFMTDYHSLIIGKQEIIDLYPDDLILPISSNEKFSILRKLINQKEYTITASAGEIDMTKYKPFFNLKRMGDRVLTGAQILRYSITDNPSQGDVVYLDKQYQCISEKRKEVIQNPRIVMQRITGVDSKRRLVCTYIKSSCLCANSANYISVDKSIDYLYLLGVLNSSVINFFVKQTSTNTNITSQVIASFPIINSHAQVQNHISVLVGDILLAKKNGNETIALQKEKLIDLLIYHLYGLTYDEVLIVDPETSITREEYEMIDNEQQNLN